MEKNKNNDFSYLDLIFRGKNKSYGAYLLRKNYARRAVTATAIILGLFALIFFSFKFKADKPVEEESENVNKEVVMAEPPPLKENQPPPPPPPDIPPPVKPQVKFTPPVIKPNEEVTKDDKPEPPKPKENVDVGIKKIEGDPTATLSANDLAPGPGKDEGAPKTVEPVKKDPPTKIFKSVSKMPAFKGNLKSYLSNNLRYPAVAQEQGIEGVVPVQFIVEPDGRITGIKVLRDPGGGLGAEAKRVIKKMPKWSPGEQNGQAVRVYFIQNVMFKLQ